MCFFIYKKIKQLQMPLTSNPRQSFYQKGNKELACFPLIRMLKLLYVLGRIEKFYNHRENDTCSNWFKMQQKRSNGKTRGLFGTVWGCFFCCCKSPMMLKPFIYIRYIYSPFYHNQLNTTLSTAAVFVSFQLKN